VADRAAESWPTEDCSSDDSLVQDRSFTVTPRPLEKGKPLVVTVHGDLQQAVDRGAYVKVVVKYGLIKLFSTTLGLAEELEDNDAPVQLPVQPGKVSLPLYYGTVFAEDAPQGTYHLQIDAYNDDDTRLACVESTLQVSR
jgi:hypothetical protein